MSTDPTQVPPFGNAAILGDQGVVTGFAGWANQAWIDQQNDPALVLAPEGTAIGDTYSDGVFHRPETLPTQEDTDV